MESKTDMRVEFLTSGMEHLWNHYVDTHAEATFFHRSGWKRVIEQSMGHRGYYLMALKDENIVGIYPLFILSTGLFGVMGVSLPFVNYGGIVADNPEAESILISKAEKLAIDSGCSYIELRQRAPLQIDLPTSEHKVSSRIPLEGGADAVFSRLHRNVRNKIRKSAKHGVEVEQGNQFINEFYEIYSRNLRDLGTPVMSRRFFECAASEFPDSIAVFRATRKNNILAAKVTLLDDHTCYFEWSASRKDSLQYAPVHAMNWTAIENACANGCSYIDFGRSTAESSHQNFKKYWGVETQTMKWMYQLISTDRVPELQKENPKFSMAIALWKRLPLSISRIIGPLLARRLP